MGKKVVKRNSLDGMQRVMLLPEHYPELNGKIAQAWVKDGKIVKIIRSGDDTRRTSTGSVSSRGSYWKTTQTLRVIIVWCASTGVLQANNKLQYIASTSHGRWINNWQPSLHHVIREKHSILLDWTRKDGWLWVRRKFRTPSMEFRRSVAWRSQFIANSSLLIYIPYVL